MVVIINGSAGVIHLGFGVTGPVGDPDCVALGLTSHCGGYVVNGGRSALNMNSGRNLYRFLESDSLLFVCVFCPDHTYSD